MTSPTVPDEPERPAASIYPILAVNFVGTLGFSIVLPFLVFLVTRWGGNAFLYGVMGATYSVFQLIAFNLYYIAFPVHAVSTLTWSVRDTGICFSVMSLLMATVQGPVLGFAARRWRDRQLAAVGSLVLAFSFVFLLSKELLWVSVGVAFLAIGNGLMWPSVVSLLTRASGRAYQGAVQGFASSAGGTASIIGLLLGGTLYTRLESRVFALSASVILVVFVLTLFLSK